MSDSPPENSPVSPGSSSSSELAIREAARLLARGGVIVFPTETVYGVGASVRQPRAIARIFEIKRRPRTRPLMVHVRDSDALDAFGASVPGWARTAARAVWPGPLTLVVGARANVPPIAIAGGKTVGLRAPDHPAFAALLDALGEIEGGVPGIVGTSANRHAAVPATTAAQVRNDLAEELARGEFEGIGALVDGGDCGLGIESTVVVDDAGVPRVLRAGAISGERLRAITGLEVVGATAADAGAVSGLVAFVEPGAAPGPQLAGDVVVATVLRPTDSADGVRWVAVPSDLEARAQTLFALLRELERARTEGARIVIERAPDHGLGVAINARLERWAAGHGVD